MSSGSLQRIGHYRLGKNLGIGSFGKVRRKPKSSSKPRVLNPLAALAQVTFMLLLLLLLLLSLPLSGCSLWFWWCRRSTPGLLSRLRVGSPFQVPVPPCLRTRVRLGRLSASCPSRRPCLSARLLVPPLAQQWPSTSSQGTRWR